jgi:putative transposase
MPTGLRRYQQGGGLHHITFSCVRHRPILGTAEARDVFLALLERTRELYEMRVYGYVVMPTHVHMLVGEPEEKPLSIAMQVLKRRFSKTRPEEFVWERRYYDFNVRSEDKRMEKMVYMHKNPVRDGLVDEPDQWRWSSFRSYAYLEDGPVKLTRV